MYEKYSVEKYIVTQIMFLNVLIHIDKELLRYISNFVEFCWSRQDEVISRKMSLSVLPEWLRKLSLSLSADFKIVFGLRREIHYRPHEVASRTSYSFEFP